MGLDGLGTLRLHLLVQQRLTSSDLSRVLEKSLEQWESMTDEAQLVRRSDML